MKTIISLVLWVWCFGFTSIAATVTNAGLSLPTSAAFSGVVNFRPGDSNVVTVNPPRFSWSYTPASSNASSDIEYKLFQFQCSTQSNFATFDVNVRTEVNFYNFLAPFTNSPVYWRVYYVTTNGVTNATSATRSFSWTNGTPTWSRARFADTNYLATNAVHPYIMFTAGNRLAVSNNLATNALVRWELLEYFATNATAYYGWPTNWPHTATPVESGTATSGSTTSFTDIGKSWTVNAYQGMTVRITNGSGAGQNFRILSNTATIVYISGTSSPALDNTSAYRILDPIARSLWATSVGYNALWWQLNRKSNTLDALPGVALASLATNYLSALSLVQGDTVGVGGIAEQQALALGYDWLYDLMTTQQKTQVLAALDARCDWIVNGSGIFGTPGWTNAGTVGTGGPSHNKGGHSHDIENFNNNMICALAIYNDGFNHAGFTYTNGARLFQHGLNYMLGVTYSFGFDGAMNQGRGYAIAVGYIASSFALSHLQFDRTFPGIDMGRSPWWQNNADWWDWMHPVGFVQGTEPWGDGGFGRDTSYTGFNFGRDIAWLTGNGKFFTHWTNEVATYAPFDGRDYNYIRAPLYYYFGTPTSSPATNTGHINPEDGWAFAATYAPHERRAFTNGLGFIFAARPRGSEMGHSSQGDLSFQLYAYGATLTDSGAEQLVDLGHVPHSQYSLLVKGYGPVNTIYQTLVDGDYQARFLAFHNSETNAFLSADGTKGYPRIAFTVSGASLPPVYASTHGAAPLRDLTKVRRHLAFPEKKYWVFHDEMTATTNWPVSVPYHILEPGLAIDTNAGTFTYSSTNGTGTGGAVTTKVSFASSDRLNWFNFTRAGDLIVTNPFLAGYMGATNGMRRTNALWINSHATNNWKNSWAVCPQKPGVHGPWTTVWRDYRTGCFTNASALVSNVVFFGEPSDAPVDATHIYSLEQAIGGGSGLVSPVSSAISGATIRAGTVK